MLFLIEELTVDGRDPSITSAIFNSDQTQNKQNKAENPISIRSSSSFSEDLPDVAELYPISQGRKTMRDEQGNSISADEIPPTASAISARGSRGVGTKSRT